VEVQVPYQVEVKVPREVEVKVPYEEKIPYQVEVQVPYEVKVPYEVTETRRQSLLDIGPFSIDPLQRYVKSIFIPAGRDVTISFRSDDTLNLWVEVDIKYTNQHIHTL